MAKLHLKVVLVVLMICFCECHCLANKLKEYRMTTELAAVFLDAPLSKLQEQKFTDYIRRLHRRLRGNWFPRGHDERTAVVEFHIEKDGKVSKVSFQRSSGLEHVDRSAILAVEKSSPFLPLPDMILRLKVVSEFSCLLDRRKLYVISAEVHKDISSDNNGT